MEVDVVKLCPEFPNDNPALHRGVSWLCLGLTGPAVAVREAVETVPPVDVAPGIEPIADVVAAEIAEIAEALALAIEPPPARLLALVVEPQPPSVGVEELIAPAEVAPFEIEAVPAARISGIVPVGRAHDIDDETDDEILVEELPPLDENAPVEGVEGVVVKVGALRPIASTTPTTLPPAPDDPFTVLLTTLADVAVGAGSPHVASLLPGLLLDGRLDHALPADAAQALAEAGITRGTEATATFVAQTRAWRAILDGSSDDFSACGNAMLDEWSAELIARLLGAPVRATALRRELRERGVAAFGLVEAA